MLASDTVLQERYQIIRQLGHGGMGAVYEARDKRLGSSVALKEIIIDLNGISDERQREIFRRAFEREAKLLANLHYESFPRVTDYFSEDNSQFLIMELVYGDDLYEQLIKKRKSFPIETILKWTEQLLDALDYLHTQDPPIFHRDIKPQNLKVTARGKIKLLDFGIAKSVDAAASTTNHTIRAATLNYAPIEQILPAIEETFRELIKLKHPEKADKTLNQKTDAGCDLYAVGATVYHLLTNRLPTDAARRSLDIWEGKPDPLPDPSELNFDISSDFTLWLLKAMEIERENRFLTAFEMQEALQTLIGEERIKKKATENSPIMPVPSTAPDQEVNAKRLITLEGIDLEPAADTQAAPTFQGEYFSSSLEDKIAKDRNELTEHLVASNTKPEFPETTFPDINQDLKLEGEDELTGKPYYDENLLAQHKQNKISSPKVAVAIPKEAAQKSKPFWIILIPLVSVLAVGAIGGAVWLNSSNSANTKKPAVNSNISTPTALPTATASIEPLASPTIMPSASPTFTPMQSNSEKLSEKPKPSATNTPNKSQTQNPVKPKPPRAISDDCIYNGKCS